MDYALSEVFLSRITWSCWPAFPHCLSGSLPEPLKPQNEGEQGNAHNLILLLSTRVANVGKIFLKPVPAGICIMIAHEPNQEVIIEDLSINHK
jgi:hypothetical protein